jgi:hypothetical protein
MHASTTDWSKFLTSREQVLMSIPNMFLHIFCLTGSVVAFGGGGGKGGFCGAKGDWLGLAGITGTG